MNMFMSLSPKFQEKAALTAALSYRSAIVENIFQLPDQVDFVRPYYAQLTDRVETGLDAAVLMRAGIEAPSLLPHIKPFLRNLNAEHTLAGQERASERKAEAEYSEYESGEELDYRHKVRLEERAQQILDAAYDIAKNFPDEFVIDFKKSAKAKGHPVPTKEDNAQVLVEARFASPLGKMKRTREFLGHWVHNTDASLNRTLIKSWTLAANPEALSEAQQYLETRYRKLETGHDKKLILH